MICVCTWFVLIFAACLNNTITNLNIQAVLSLELTSCIIVSFHMVAPEKSMSRNLRMDRVCTRADLKFPIEDIDFDDFGYIDRFLR